MTDYCPYSRRLDAALGLAADAFRHRRRKCTTIPYLSHLLAVTAIVMEYGGDEEQCIAAVLHDLLEDVPGATAADLARDFGPEVARLVRAQSDATDARHKAPWLPRKQRYLAHLRTTDDRVRLVSAADKLHNVQSIRRDLDRIGDDLWARFTGRRIGTLWYHRAVVDALADGWTHPLLRVLEDETRSMFTQAGSDWPATPAMLLPRVEAELGA